MKALWWRWLRPVITTRSPAKPTMDQLVKQGQKLAASVLLDTTVSAPSLGITSPLGGEGKTLIAATVAAALSRSRGAQTVLVECSWERPAVHRLFDIPATPGVAEWLRGECSVERVRHTVSENLAVIPAGSANEDELLLVDQLREKGMATLIGRDGCLVIDLPPVLSTGSALLAAKLVDSVILVAQSGVTPTVAIQEACAALCGVRLRGVVLNQVEHWIPSWIERML